MNYLLLIIKLLFQLIHGGCYGRRSIKGVCDG